RRGFLTLYCLGARLALLMRARGPELLLERRRRVSMAGVESSLCRMTFPVEFNLAGHRVPAHAVLELAAYVVGVQFYFFLRRRGKLGAASALPVDQNLWLIVGCVMGAMVGSK